MNIILDEYERSVEKSAELFVSASPETRARFAKIIDRAKTSALLHNREIYTDENSEQDSIDRIDTEDHIEADGIQARK